MDDKEIRSGSESDSSLKNEEESGKSGIQMWERSPLEERKKNGYKFEKKAEEMPSESEKKERESEQAENAFEKKKEKIKLTKKPAQEKKTKARETDTDSLEEILNRDNVSKQMKSRKRRTSMIQGGGRKSGLRSVIYEIRRNWKRFAAGGLACVLILGGAGYYNKIRRFHSYDLVWQSEAMESTQSAYYAFQDVILQYSQDNVSCIDLDGKVLWSQTFNMASPAIAVKGAYAIIYDVKGTSFYICTKEECTGMGTAERTILKADISAAGVAALILEDNKSNFINYYRKDGSRLDIEVKTIISGDGYPVDLAVSPDGTQLMTSYMYTDNTTGQLCSRLVMRNFEIGKNNADRLVGGFDDYGDRLIPEVLYFDDRMGAAVTENSIDFYSSRNAQKPERVLVQEMDAHIRTVFHNEAYIGVILEKESRTLEASDAGEGESAAAEIETAGVSETEEAEKEQGYPMKIYDKDGNLFAEASIDFEYEQAQFSGDGIVVYNNHEWANYNMNGVLKYQASGEAQIEDVLRFKENTLVLYANRGLQKIILK